MTAFIYFHGLGSSAQSRKFKLLKHRFSTHYEIECINWNELTNFNMFFSTLFKRYKKAKEIVIIGDSTGGNYAFQFRNIIKNSGTNIKLVLLNPLMNIDIRIAAFPFPDVLVNSLVKVDTVYDCLLLISMHDELIGHDVLAKNSEKGSEVVLVNDSHRLLRFKEWLGVIEDYIKGK